MSIPILILTNDLFPRYINMIVILTAGGILSKSIHI